MKRSSPQWENCHELINIPTPGDKLSLSHNDHADDGQQRQRDGVFEGPGDFRDLDEEVGDSDFFGCGAPGHVDGEHVAHEGLRDV